MTDLWHSLLKSEYSYLKIIAQKWGFDFTARDAREGIDQVVDAFLTGEFLADISQALAPGEKEILVWLDDQGGKSPWDHITRKFGQVREMGAGKLDRERPDLDPISPLESLWYRALIARGFLETETGPQEFAFLPDDLREMIMPLLNPGRSSPPQAEFFCRVAAPRERTEILPRPWFILDQICTLLVGIRMDQDPALHMPDLSEPETGFYRGLAKAAGLLDGAGVPLPGNIRDFLDLADPEALRVLWDSWGGEEMLPELFLVPGLEVEGDPPLDAPRVRERLLSLLAALPQGEWWSMESFLTQVKERHPDFMRTGGEYQSWFIKRKSSQVYLNGFENWDQVEGALLRFLITGPLRWMGMSNLAAPEEDSPPLAFQLTALFEDFITEKLPALPERTPDQVQLRSQGEIRMTTSVPRKARYQIARFCDWHPIKAEAYQYRISPDSLLRAESQELRAPHLLSLLKKHAEAIPPNLLAALERWEKSGPQASIEPRTVLRLGSPAILKALKKSRASRFILEQLGPTVVLIRPESEEKIIQSLMELGFFVQSGDQSGSQT